MKIKNIKDVTNTIWDIEIVREPQLYYLKFTDNVSGNISVMGLGDFITIETSHYLRPNKQGFLSEEFVDLIKGVIKLYYKTLD